MSGSSVRESINLLARTAACGVNLYNIASRAVRDGLHCRWAGIAVLDEPKQSVAIPAFTDGAGTQPPLPAPLSAPLSDCLMGTFCGDAGGRRRWALHGDLAAIFVNDSLLKGRSVRFFAAHAIVDRAGAVVGYVFAMDDRVRAESPEIWELLTLVADRIGADDGARRVGGDPASDFQNGPCLNGDAPVICWEMGRQMDRFTYISPYVEVVLGYPRESWYDAGVWCERVNPKDRDLALAALAVAANEGRGGEFEFRVTAADDREMWLHGVVAPCEGGTGEARLGGLWIDLSRQTAIQRELSQSVQRFRDFAEADTDWFWEMDESLRFTFLSEQFQDATGVDPASLLGKDRRQLLANNDSVVDEYTTEADWERHIRVLEAHEPFQDFRHSRPAGDGQRFFLSISGKPVFDAAGTFKGYRGTGSNITEQVLTEQALRESERQLRLQSDRVEEASRAKSEFLANMSHEIRTPLNAILGFSDSMQREILGPIGNDKYREYVAAIHASGRHLLELVNDVLDLSKIEAGRYVLTRSTVDLVAVVEACLQITRETAGRKSIKVVFDAAADFPAVSIDLRAIKQVILNLLSNALKYTEPGGRVNVALELQGGDVYIQVADTGIGIPEADIATLKEAFFQGRSNQAYLAHEGTGLGLAITDSLVVMHGGSLSIESEVGIGTVVRVHLPGAVVASRAAG